MLCKNTVSSAKLKKRQEMKVSLFDRFVSKEPGEQKGKVFLPTPYTKRFSELDASSKEAKAQYPDDSKTVDDFLLALKTTCRSRYKKALDELQPMKAEARFFLSRDRMCAYACLLPPENHGDEISLDEFLEDMHFEGINYGILEQEIPQEFDAGYLHIFPVARGKLPLPGEDGKVTELFQRRKNMRMEVQSGSQVDFSQDVQIQPIRKGTAICLIRLPRAGTSGMDVTGQELPSPEVVGACIPQGKNTAIGRGGQALTASVDGILYIENEKFCIHEQKIIDGNVDQFQGRLRISGNLYIGGNVDGGVDIEATGDIVINGTVGQARVASSGGTIRIQKGIYGTNKATFLSAAGQIQSPVVERAVVDAGTSVITETISNSTIECGGMVYAMSGRGMIVDSVIRAQDSILCVRIGNLAGGRNQFSVGYPPQIPEMWKQIKTDLKEVQTTIERLWELITGLRKKGSRISEDEQDLLKQLVEQRNFYTEKREALTIEFKSVNKVLDKKSKGKIRCEKLYPTLDVQIGRLSEQVLTVEENCDIHVEDNKIFLE